MSFDKKSIRLLQPDTVSIPLEQGNVFRHNLSNYLYDNIGLNPFGTGQCLSTITDGTTTLWEDGLNPFGTGQCLSTR